MNRAHSRALGVMGLMLLAGCVRLDAQVGSDPPAARGGASNAADAGASNVADRGASNAADGGASSCDSAAPLELYYRNLRASDVTDLINFIVKVENRSAAPVPLATLQVRYYFSDELSAPTLLEVYYSDTCCSNKSLFKDQVLASVHSVSASASADAYFEIGFDPSVGELAPGDSVQVEIGYSDPASIATSTQQNDYSYLASATGTQADWDACPGPDCRPTFTTCNLTVYQAGVLVWGAPP